MSTLLERAGKAGPITARMRKALGVDKALGGKSRNRSPRPMHANQTRSFYDALPHPLLTIAADGMISDANTAAEAFFDMGVTVMRRHRLDELMPFASQLVAVIEQAKERGAPVNEYRVDIGTQKTGSDRLVDIFAAPMPDPADGVFVMLQERTIADKMDRQLTHLGAARSVSGLAAMLAHEIKNPLSGIRGAAQLLESAVGDEDRALTRLICDEADRIVKLVDRMEMFSDGRPIERESVNLHAVLDHVKRVAQAGFARHIRFEQEYDPSLPPVLGNRDQLVQVFLNLVKNAAEAIGPDAIDGQIELCSAFRPGFRLRNTAGGAPVALPLEFTIRDNGPGIAPNLMGHLFEPFVTTKASGSGLGLAMVAKIVGDHGGIIECDSHPRRTSFRVLLPMYAPTRERRPRRDE